jgi:hypothetical protein
MEEKKLFEEKQKFNQWWLWLLLLGLTGFITYKIFIEKDYGNGSKTIGIIVLILMFSLLVLFYFINLKTRVYSDRIEIKFFPFINHWKKYPFASIEKMEVIQYNPILDYGGWGIRLGAYNTSGNKGLKIYYKKKNYRDSILIGTQKPEELAKIIKNIQL